MKDYYKILDVPKTASSDEIKKAYRKMAMKHHPDRGGDQVKFKEISEAYEVLSDNEKRQMVDQGFDPNNPNQGFQGNPFQEFRGGPGFHSMEDIFNSFGFTFNFGGPGGFTRQNVQRNKSLNVNMTITLEEAYKGVTKDINLRYPSGKNKNISISIPRGMDNGMSIRYPGMGDDEIPGVPPGDLTISINVLQHPVFAREGLNLLTEVSIDCFDAILGTDAEITTLDGRTLQVVVPPGTQPSTTLGLKNEGMIDQAGNTGKLYIRVNVTIPRNLDSNKQQLIKQIKN
jgi:curved DNA-binding protein